MWWSSNSSTLIAIALFVLLGEILARGGIAECSYADFDKWVSWLPGGLIHANIATAALFSATSGVIGGNGGERRYCCHAAG